MYVYTYLTDFHCQFVCTCAFISISDLFCILIQFHAFFRLPSLPYLQAKYEPLTEQAYFHHGNTYKYYLFIPHSLLTLCKCYYVGPTLYLKVFCEKFLSYTHPQYPSTLPSCITYFYLIKVISILNK